MGQTPISERERRRREAQATETRRKQQTGRVIFGDTPTIDLPEPIGRVALKYRNVDLEWLERALTPLLDELPDRLRYVTDDDGRQVELLNVWDALEVLTNRAPMFSIRRLIYAGTRHAGVTEEQTENLPPSIYDDPNVERAVGSALAVALGATEEDDDPTEGPTEADA